jgi:hypothetical protein
VKSRTRGRSLSLSAGSESLISHAGAALLLETARASGLRRGLGRALERWERPRAQHHPGQVVLDLAVAVALGGDCLSDLDVVRSQPGLFGQVASDATVSRVIAGLAADADAVLDAIGQARAAARAQVWSHRPAVPADGPVIELVKSSEVEDLRVGPKSLVGSAWGAVPGLRPVRFPMPPAEPDVRLSPHPALHVSRLGQPVMAAAARVQGVGIAAPR